MANPPGVGALTGALLTALTLALSLAYAQGSDDARAVVAVATEATPMMVEDSPELRWALLIGVDAYDHDGIRDLRYAGNDVRAVAEQLISSGTYLPDHVVMMTTNPDANRPDLLPSRNNILLKLAWLRSLPESQSLLFYFSGHGLAGPKGERKTYLLPMDALDEDPISTGLDLDEVLHKLGAVRARQRLVVLDACRNQLPEDGSRAMEQAWPSRPLSLAEGTQVIFATSHGERSYEDDTWKMGVFTHTFVEALKGAADGSGKEGAADQLVTVREVFDYATSKLEVQGQKGRMQIPTMGGESTGDFLLVKLPDPPLPLPSHPLPVTSVAEQGQERRGLVLVEAGEARLVSLRAQDGTTYFPGQLPAGTYALRAQFDGFHEGPVGELTVLPGETTQVRCSAAFVACDVVPVGEGGE